MSDYSAKLALMPIFKIFDEDTQQRMLRQSDAVLSRLIAYLEEQTPSWQKSRDDLQKIIQNAPREFKHEVSKFMHKVEEDDKKAEIEAAETQINQNINT